LIWCVVLIAAGCIDSYLPPFIDTDLDDLVVDGFINLGASTTTIKLTHLMKLETPGNAKTELKATITVEGENTGNYLLSEKSNGVYSGQLNISNRQRYRLRIKTKAGKEYLSDFETPKNTPAIDVVSMELNQPANGLQVYVSTHDPLQEAKYYQWEYEETWQYHADCYDPVDLTPKYTCWKTTASTSIFISSSSRLNEDIVSTVPLAFVDANSEKIAIQYSILVRQYAISKGRFEYLQQLKKTTEQLGSIFDPQPSQLLGNIHSVSDPEEQIIGYIGVYDVVEKRIFISNSKLPNWFYKIPYWYNCPPPLEGDCSPTPSCADCRSRGGTNVKPAYWIY
jgi:hypothetical protein